MFDINNEKIGRYIKTLLNQKFKSQNDFCRAYLTKKGCKYSNDEFQNALKRLANRLSQIIKGAKAIQLEDLPIFTDLLEVTCEQLLSAGKYSVPKAQRITLYSVACSDDPVKWEEFINRDDNLILNSDEYSKTVIDYALEFGNYRFLKYLIDKNYIYFENKNHSFAALTTIKRKNSLCVDFDGLAKELNETEHLRIDLIVLAIDNNDVDMLYKLRAREVPELYETQFSASYIDEIDKKYDCNERLLEHISRSNNEEILNYFTDSFEISSDICMGDRIKKTYTFPYLSELICYLIKNGKSDFAKTALKKATEHNKKAYEELKKLIILMKDSKKYASNSINTWMSDFNDNHTFYVGERIVYFSTYMCDPEIFKKYPYFQTNIVHANVLPSSADLKDSVDELNASYDRIKNIPDKLEIMV